MTGGSRGKPSLGGSIRLKHSLLLPLGPYAPDFPSA